MNTVLSGGFSGPIIFDRVFYNVSLQGGRRYSDLSSLLTGDPTTLQGLGISRDSVSALTTAASARGIPINAGGVPANGKPTRRRCRAPRLDADAAGRREHHRFAATQRAGRVVRVGDGAPRPRRRPHTKRRRRHRRVLGVRRFDDSHHDRLGAHTDATEDALRTTARRARARHLAARRWIDRPGLATCSSGTIRRLPGCAGNKL